MEITLEKIELVKDRTGATYKEAKEALEKSNGNVVEAIIAIEDSVDGLATKKVITTGSGAILNKMKEIVLRGNVAKIIVKKGEKKILEAPFNVGVAGVILAPWGMLIGAIAAFGTKCTVDIVKADGTIICITDKAGVVVEEVITKGSKAYNTVKEKAPKVYDAVKEKGANIYGTAKDTISKVADTIKSTATITDEDFDAEWFDGDADYSEIDGNISDDDESATNEFSNKWETKTEEE